MRRRLADEGGLTLVELLVAVVVLGTGFVTIMAGLTTTMRATDLHHQQSQAEAVVREYAEAVDAAPFVSCATTYSPDYTPPLGWTVELTGIAYWDKTARSFGTTCAAGSVQLVSVAVHHDSVTETLQVAKRQR